MARERSVAQHVARLARLAQTLHERQIACIELERCLAPFEAARMMVVEGEAALLQTLQDRLNRALALLQALEEVEDLSQAATPLDELDGVLTDPEWEAAETICADLQSKHQRQEEIVRGYADGLADWRAQITRLKVELEAARAVRAPVAREQRGWSQLDDTVTQAERALREREYVKLLESLEQLAQSTAPEQLIQQVGAKKMAAQPLAQQVQLLLLQARLDPGLRQYTVLLRTPSEPGIHGINVQDSTTIVEQDRQRVIDDFQTVTKAIEQGRNRGDPPAVTLTPAGLYEPVTAVEGGGFGASAAAATPTGVSRDFRFASEVSIAAPVKLNDLVQNVGDLMYSILIPEHMQTYLLDQSCSLTITTNDLALPWELMYFPTKNTFLCLDRPVARMPMGTAFPRAARPRPRIGKLRFLLVYSDPDANLPSARQEIEEIREALNQSEWQDQVTTVVLGPDTASGRNLNAILQAGDFDVIHFAGHAGFDLRDPDLSGLLLREKELFFAQKVRRLLRGRPLVFLNACQSGRTANEDDARRGIHLPRPAEGLASAFIYGGALGCIGSFWPISDRPAAAFAIAFYRQVLEGHMIGEAMRLAREETRRAYPDQITWAAFVLYGDPTFTLVA